jgi:hypothetical protein
MKTIQTTDKAVTVVLMKNDDSYTATACYGGDYWFHIGYYKTEKSAITRSKTKMKKHNIELLEV